MEPIYTGACNILSIQRIAALTMVKRRIAVLAEKGAEVELDSCDEKELMDLVTRKTNLEALLKAGCPA